MKHLKTLRFAAHSLLLLLFAASLHAAAVTTKYIILFDADNSSATGCTYTVGTTSIQGIEHVLTTTVDRNGSSATVSKVERQQCTGGAFSAPITVDSTGWPASFGSDGAMHVVTHIPNTVFGATVPLNMRLYIGVIEGGGASFIETTPNGSPILYPTMGPRHRAVAHDGIPDEPVTPTLDGSIGMFNGLPPMFLGPPVVTGSTQQLINSVFGLSGLTDLYFLINIGGNVTGALVANPDSYTVQQGHGIGAGAPGVLTNDINTTGSPMLAQLLTSTHLGTLTLNADGSFHYNNSGAPQTTDSFTYKATAGGQQSDPATVTFHITPDSVPVGLPDSYSVGHHGTLNVAAPGVLINDTDADHDPLTAVIDTPPAHASNFHLNANGSFTYTHDGSNTLSDTFKYRATDGIIPSLPVTVTITIAADQAPVAAPDNYTVAEGGTLNIGPTGVLANDSDPDNEPITAVLNAGPAHAASFQLNADGSFTYVHDGSETTSDSFTYHVTDGILSSGIVTVSITVTTVNDAPVANPDAYTTLEDQTLNVVAPGVLGNDTDAEGNALTATVLVQPTKGTLTLNADGSFTYVPNPNVNGTDTFQYTVTDNGTTNGSPDHKSATGTVTITITAVNDVPTYTAGSNVSVASDSGAYSQPWASAISAGPSDESGQTLNFIVSNDNNSLFSVQPAISASGVLTFTPSGTNIGTANVSVQLHDNGGTANGGVDTTTVVNFTITITCPTILVGNPSVSTGTAASPFSQTFTQSGAIGAATFTTASTLPTGLTLSAGGVLSGTPTQTGSFPIVVTVTDSKGCIGTSATYTLVISCQTITVNNPATNTGVAAAAFSQTFTQSGAIGATTFSTASTLPTGLTLSSAGLLSGTPTQTGTFPIVVTVTDSNGCTGTGSTYTLTITCQTINVTNPATTTGTANAAFSQTFTQSGAIGAATFSTASTLPAGLTLSTGGVLSGTPLVVGSFPIVVTVTDSNGCTGTGATYTLVISCQTISVTNPATTTGTAASAFSQTFTAGNTIGAVTFTTASTLPTGLTLSTAGVLSGTPTQTGTFPIVVTATDANGCSGSGATYTLVINCQTITVTKPANSTGTVSAPFSEQFTQSGSIGAATFSTASTLPAGLTLSSSGLLSGTPTQTGTFPIVVTVTDSNGCTGSSATYTLVINCQVITVNNPSSNSDPAGTALVAANFTFTQTGAVGGATFTTASTLPTGVTLTTAGVLTGTPSQGGTFPITVTVTDGNGCTGTSSGYVLTITCPVITVTNPATTTGTVNVAFSQTFSQSGGIGTTTFSTASTLPAGLTLSSAGLLSGTPTQNGSFPIVVTATDSNGCQGTGSTYTLVIACQVIPVTNPVTNTGTVNTAFSQSFSSSNTIGTVTYTTSSTLPAGLSLAANGTLSGTPTQIGSFPIVVTATDANGCSGSGSTYTLTIGCQVISVTNPATTTGTAASAFSQTFTAGNTIGAVTFTTASTLPTGLSLSTAGVLSGTPTQTGTFPIVVTATDANGCSGSGPTYTLVIGCQTITVTKPVNATGAVSAPFSEQFTQSGAIGTATFTTASTLPNGLTLSTSGLLSGTPTQNGSFPIVVTVTDSNGCTGNSATYTLTINCQVITVNNPSSNTDAAGTALVAANFTFTQTGAVGGATFTTASTLPTGVTLTTGGVLTGTPMQGGSFPITVTVTDGNGCTGTSSGYTLTITCPVITVTNPATTTGTVNVAFSQTFNQSGGVGTTTFSTASTLPAGLTLNSSTGVLSGTPTQSGTFPIVVTATDSNGCQGTGSTYSLVIACQVITVTNPATNTGTVDAAFSQTFTSSNTIGTVTYTTSSTLPAGLTLSTGGVLSGTPTVPGTFPIVVTATDANGCQGSGSTYTLTINCQTITVTNPVTNSGTVDAAFSQTFTQSGAHGTATFTTASALPAGITLSTAGVLSGTPTVKGTFPIVVIVTDSNGCTGTGSTYTLTINCQTITVTKPVVTGGTVNAAFSQTFTQSGAHATATFTTASTLPNGLTLSTGGVLAGTPTQPGTFPIVVTVTDANGCTGTSSTYTLVIACQTISVTNPATTTGTVNAPFSQTFNQTGGFGTTNFTTSSTLPNGLSLSTAGVLSGTPTQSGSFPMVVRATDSNGCFGDGATYTLVIACNVITVTNPGVTTGTAGVLFNQTFNQSGGTGTITWSETGALPTGITLNTSTGVLSGTTSQTGSFPITVTATDQNGCQGTGSTYTLVISCQTVTITNASSNSVQAGVSLTPASNWTFTATGILGTATWSETGALPTGITLNTSTGVLSGSTTQLGSFPITVQVTDTNGCFGTSSYTLTVTCPVITVTRNGGGSFPAATFNAAYAGQSVVASGGGGTYTFAVTAGSLPTGLTLASGGGISGTPTATGTFSFTVTATDTASLCTGSQAFTIAVKPVHTDDSYSNLVNNTEAVITGGATTSPTTPFVGLTGAIIGNDFPSGGVVAVGGTFSTTQGGSVTIASDGTFKYTPPVTASALTTDSFTYTLSSDTGATGTATTDTGTVTLNLSGRVWYVKNNVSNGNGQSQSPFNSTTNFSNGARVSPDAAGDIIFIYNGDGTTTNLTSGVKLLANEQLIGEGVALVVNTKTLVAAGTKPQITNTAATSDAVTLAAGNTVKGLTITGATRDGIAGSSVAGFTGDTLTIQNNTSSGLHLTSMTGTVTVTNATISGNAVGLDVNNGTAAITLDNTNTITANAGQRQVSIQNRPGAAGAIAIGATINDSVAGSTGILVNNNTSGTITFSGAQTLRTTTNAAVNLTTNTGATVNFSGTLNVTTTTGVGFNATGGGTLNVTGTANVTAGAATQGVNINGVTVGASGATFASVTTNGATTGVSLTSLGNGNVTINGGTIDGGTTGISLTTLGTSNVTLSGVSIGGTTPPTTGINGSTFGTLTISGAAVNVKGVTALNLATGAVTGTFNTVNSTGGTNGVNLNAVTGSWGATSGTLTGATGSTFNVTGGSGGTIAWGTVINQANGALAVSIAGSNSNTVNFTGNVTTSATATGISISASTGTYNFTGAASTIAGTGGGIVIFNEASGTISFGSGYSITGATTSFKIGGSATNVGASITYSGTITNAVNGGVVLDVNSASGTFNGTLNMNGTSLSGNVAGANGVITVIKNMTGTLTVNNLSLTSSSNTFANTLLGISGTNTAGSFTFNHLTLSANGNGHTGKGVVMSGGGTLAITATGGTSSIDVGSSALDLNGVTLNTSAIATMNSLGPGTSVSGVSLVSVTGGGTLTVTGGALTGIAGAPTFNVNGGSPQVSFGGTITQANGNQAVAITGISSAAASLTFSNTITKSGTAANAVSITSNTNGTYTFSGAITASTSTANAINLVTNTGATIAFSGNLGLTTTTGTAFNATGGGTVTATNASSTVTAVGGVGVNIANTTIGAGNVTFFSVNANGGSAGISIDTTGANGAFIVTGTVASTTKDNSGGTIQNMTGTNGTSAGHGIYLNSTKNVSIKHMSIQGNQGDGIHGNAVNGATIQYCNIGTTSANGNTTAQLGNFHGEGDVQFVDLTTSALIDNNAMSNAFYKTLGVFNNNATSVNRVVITNNTFGTQSAANGDDAVTLQATDGTFNATFSNNTVTWANGDMFQIDLHGGVSSDLIMASNQLNNTAGVNIISGGGGVTIGSGGAADHVTFTFNINNNTVTGAQGAGMGITTGSTGVAGKFQNFSGSVTNNTFGNTGSVDSGSTQGSDFGIIDSGSIFNVTITGNHLSQYNPSANGAMAFTIGDDAGNVANFVATITGNVISNPGSNAANVMQGIAVNVGPSAADVTKACLTMWGNTLTGSGKNGGSELRVRQRASSHIGLLGNGTNYSGAANDTTAVVNFETSQNTVTNAAAVSATTNAPGGFQGTCP